MSRPRALKYCADWVEEALSDLNAVLYSYQAEADYPRTDPPYAIVRFLTVESAGRPYTKTTDTLSDEEDPTSDLVKEIITPMEALLRIDLYGSGSMDRAMALRPSLDLAAVQEIFDEAVDAQDNSLELVVREWRTIQDATLLRDTVWEESAFAEVRVAWLLTQTTTIDIITTVGFDGQGDIADVDFEVPE